MTLPIEPKHLPAVVNALRESGVAYYVAEGDVPPLRFPRNLTTQQAYDLGVKNVASRVRVPPSEWVKLAEARCGTCGGKSSEYRGWPYPCDCVNGRPRHTLTVECDECDGKGSAYADDDLDDLGNLDWAADTEYGNPGIEVAFDCDECDGSGSVSVDVVVADVLPIVFRKRGGPPVEGQHIAVDVDNGDTFYSGGYYHGEPITTVGPDPRPGWYVVVIEQVSS